MRGASFPTYASDVSITSNEEFTLKMFDNSMRDTLLHRLNTFRRNRELCDVVLFVHEKEIFAHKIVLAACSPALMAMFVGSENEKLRHSSNSSPQPANAMKSVSSSKISLANNTALSSAVSNSLPPGQQSFSYYEFAHTDYDCFEAIVNYAYTSYLEISNKKVGELYKTAHALQVAPVSKACANYLLRNLNIMDCIGIRRQANVNDDVLVKEVDSFISKNFARIVNESQEFTLLSCIKVRLILSVNDTKRLCSGEDIALRALQYFQTLPHISDRIEQWIDQLLEKTHMLYMETNATLQDCSEMDDRSSVGALDMIQDYKRTGGYLPRNGSSNMEIQATTHHITGATPVHLNAGRLNNGKLSSAESNSSLSLSTEPEDESYKLIAVHQTAVFRATNRTVNLVMAMMEECVRSITKRAEESFIRLTVNIQLSEVENVTEPKKASSDLDVVSALGTGQQKSAEEEAVARLISSTSSSRIPLAQMNSARCSVGGAYINGKIIVCGGYDRGECLKSVEEYDLLEGCWRRLPDMAQGRGRFDAAVMEGRVYAIAGSSGSVDLKSVECYDPKAEKWSSVKSLQQGRSHNGCAALDGFIYCLGGCCEQNVLGECERYSPELNDWSAIPSLRTARFQAGCTSWCGFVVVCGGCDGWKCLDSVEAYNPKTEAWLNLAPLRTARRGCAVAVVKDSLFVIGGHDGTQSLNSVEILDNPTGQWRSGPSLTTPRANVRAIVTPGDEIYLLGGFDGTQFLSSIEVFNSESLGWRSWQQNKD